jgi:hypothetical protein
MENKINIAKLLKDCPKGMELYSPLFGDCKFVKVHDYEAEIIVEIETGANVSFKTDGRYYDYPNAECLLFPKGKTTWEGFVPPCQFKDGKIVATNNGLFIGIIKVKNNRQVGAYCSIDYLEDFRINSDYWFERMATYEEKQKLFQAIKDNGYKWNAETKTLEKVPKIKDGDIIHTTTKISEWISIFEKFDDDECKCYIDYSIDSDTYYGEVGGKKNTLCEINDIEEQRLATEEEKQKLFDVIKENGHRWNAETKTLEKLVKPKFKVGDIITKIDGSRKGEIFYIDVDRYHVAVSNDIGIDVFFEDQDEWELIYDTKPRFKVGDRIKNKHTCEIVTVKRVYELYYIVELNDTEMFLDRKLGEDYELVLVPDRFDINTLIPFESKVLVRDYVGKIWRPAFWGKYIEDSNCRYLTTNGCWVQCIPYEENKHLLGTTNDCIDFYKTW